MKIKKFLCFLPVVALAIGATSCKKEAESIADKTKDATAAVSDTVAKTVDAAKDAGAKAVADVTDKAKELAAPASAKAQELIDSAKKLVGEGKFQEALTKLKEIGGEKLSLDQAGIVSGLKAQIEKALGAAPQAATDLLPKN